MLTAGVQVDSPLLNLVIQVAYTHAPLCSEDGQSLLEELRREPRRCRTELLLKDSWAMCRAL